MERKIQLNLYLLERHRDMLQRIAAERMLENPKRSVSAAKIAAEIIQNYLEKLSEIQNKCAEIAPPKKGQYNA